MELQKRVIGRPFVKGHAKVGGRGTARVADGRTLYELFRSFTEDAARLLSKVMNNPREDMELRVRAAAMILQRGWGDAPKHLMLSPLTDTSRANELTEADILAMMGRARPALPGETIEAPPSRGDEAGSLCGTGSTDPSGMEPQSTEVIDILPLEHHLLTPLALVRVQTAPEPIPDIPQFLITTPPPKSESK